MALLCCFADDQCSTTTGPTKKKFGNWDDSGADCVFDRETGRECRYD